MNYYLKQWASPVQSQDGYFSDVLAIVKNQQHHDTERSSKVSTIEQPSDQVIANLRKAWLDMTNFGNHEGPCDNQAKCKHCGSALYGCTKHKETMQKRMNTMSEAISYVVKKYGTEG